MENTSYAEIIKNQTDSFIEILKKQNEFFIESLKNIADTNIKLISKVEAERDYYRNMVENQSQSPVISEKENTYNFLPIVKDDTIVENNNYEEMINQYLLNKDEDTFINIIEKYPQEISKTLNNCINCLPSNISTIAELYNFANELNEVNKKILIVGILNKNKGVDLDKSFEELCSEYQTAFNNGKPTLMKRYIKQIYLQYPEMFDIFKMQYKLPDNFDSIIDSIKVEMMPKEVKKRGRKPKLHIEEKPIIHVVKKEKKEKRVKNVIKPHIDYANISINDLARMVQNYKSNKRQYVKRCADGLNKAKRHEDSKIFLRLVANQKVKKADIPVVYETHEEMDYMN